MCGLKLLLSMSTSLLQTVTPFMGVWIEIFVGSPYLSTFFRHTLYGCVDWNRSELNIIRDVWVTPFMGVWIEIKGWWYRMTDGGVTPFMGVWIEITNFWAIIGTTLSHPLWVCGLKFATSIFKSIHIPSHPLWVCGLKSYCYDWVSKFDESHPLWVCGLKS